MQQGMQQGMQPGMQAMQGMQQGVQGGNQLLGNNSQNSQHSQQLMGNNSSNSQHSQNSQGRQLSVGSQNQNQNMQGNQLQAQMQALSQSHMAALNDNKGNMNQMQNQMQNQMMQNQMQNQMSEQNQMQNQLQNQSGNQEQLQQALMQQALNAQQQQQQQQSSGGIQDQLGDQSQRESQDESSQQAKPQEAQPQEQGDAGTTPLDNVSQPMSQPLSDEKGSNAKRRNSAKTRTPSGGRGKGMRGRGGKGKRLRDIADDLGAAGARVGSSTLIKTTSDSDASKKRGAGELGDGDEPASKSQKIESGVDGDGDKKDEDGDKDAGKSDKKDGQDGDQNSSLSSSMPKGDVEQHLLLLHKGLHLTSRTITHKCLPIVQQLIDDPFGWVFRDAVDPVVFGLPDYFEVVKNPMHLLLVKKKLENAVYTDMASFERDVKLVFENAILYNGEDSEVGQLANTMMGVFEKEYKKVCEGM